MIEPMLVISRSEVEALLDLDELVEALASASSDLSGGRASMPARVGAFAPERSGMLAAMVGYAPSLGALTAKLVSVFPENAAGPLPTHQAAIVIFDPLTGEPLALMDGTYITAVRTAAGSALATRLLARPDSSALALLGTGVQARAHGRAIPRVRPITEVRVAGRDPAKARALATELASELGVRARGTDSYAEAVAGADVVCVATHSRDPVLRREWLAPGTHVNSVGWNPEGRELDEGTVRDSLLVVESRDAVLAPVPSGSNDLLEPMRNGLLDAEDLREVGELVDGTRPGRADPTQITLYKSVGVAVQDAAAAALVLAAARERGIGQEVVV